MDYKAKQTIERIENLNGTLKLCRYEAQGIAEDFGYPLFLDSGPVRTGPKGKLFNDISFELYKATQRIDCLLERLQVGAS